MTADELKNTMNNAIAVLQDNKAIATPELLSAVEQLVNSLGGPAPQVDFNENFQSAVQKVGKVVDIEKRLTQTTMTDNLVEILTKIQNHPIIMRMLSHVL